MKIPGIFFKGMKSNFIINHQPTLTLDYGCGQSFVLIRVAGGECFFMSVRGCGFSKLCI